MDRLGVAGGDRGVVEEAEAHRRRHFGVMAGRPRGDEGVVDAPLDTSSTANIAPPAERKRGLPASPATSRCPESS